MTILSCIILGNLFRNAYLLNRIITTGSVMSCFPPVTPIRLILFRMAKKIIVTIDGWSSCGKSTLAKQLAKKLGYIYVDSGAMYRAITLYFLRNHVDWTDKKEVKAALESINLEFV